MTYISSPYFQKQAKINLQTQQAREKKAEEQRTAERAERIQEIQERHKLDNLHRNFSTVSEALERLPQAVTEALASASIQYPITPSPEAQREVDCLKYFGCSYAEFQAGIAEAVQKALR